MRFWSSVLMCFLLMKEVLPSDGWTHFLHRLTHTYDTTTSLSFPKSTSQRSLLDHYQRYFYVRKMQLKQTSNQEKSSSSFSDFARDDIPLSKLNQTQSRDPKQIVQANLDKLNRDMLQAAVYDKDMSMEEMRRRWEAVDNKATGYDTPDPIEEEPDPSTIIDNRAEWMKPNDEDNGIMKFVKEVYIGSPYDSRKKQQARYVVRSITLLSVGIGIVFTAIWYLSPVKFISYKGDLERNMNSNPTSNYLLYENPTKSPTYIDPDELLQSEFERSTNKQFFDDGVNPLEKANAPNPRYAPAKAKKSLSIDGRSMDL